MEAIKVRLENLFLDPNNYRLRSNPDWNIIDEKSILKPGIQKRTTYFIAGENNFKINDLIESIKINGFLKVDNILVKRYENSENYLVIEGNRRLAALKVLKEQKDKGYDIGILDPSFLDSPIEVVLYIYLNDKDYLILMGLKHVSGNKKWDTYNQSKLLYELKNQGEKEIDIAKKIGLNKSSVEQQIRGYLAIQEFLEEIKSENYGDRFDPYQKLQMFIELTTKPKLKKWIGWDENTFSFKNSDNKKRFFSWITPLIETDDESNESEIIDPIILNHKEVRELENIIDDEETLEYMERTRNFNETLSQNYAYTQRQFSKIIKNIEKTLVNIPIGNILSYTKEDKNSMQVIKDLMNEFLSKNNQK